MASSSLACPHTAGVGSRTNARPRRYVAAAFFFSCPACFTAASVHTSGRAAGAGIRGAGGRTARGHTCGLFRRRRFSSHACSARHSCRSEYAREFFFFLASSSTISRAVLLVADSIQCRRHPCARSRTRVVPCRHHKLQSVRICEHSPGYRAQPEYSTAKQSDNTWK